jgi:hypothetical protein
MAVASAIALLTASAFLRPISSGELPSTSHELVTIASPALDDFAIQSAGYLEFDVWAADGYRPGFAAMPDRSQAAVD